MSFKFVSPLLILLLLLLVLFSCFGDNYELSQRCDNYETLADSGDPNGFQLLAACYREGSGRELDVKKAEELYIKSANLGSPGGKNSLAAFYLITQRKEEKYEYAINLLRDAIKSDYAKSYYVMGIAVKNGLGVEVNIDKARWNFTEGADRYDEPSMVITAAGACYGILGFKIDYDRCVFWKDRLKKFNSYNLYTFKEYLLSELDNKFMREYVVNDEDINAVKAL